MYEAIVFEEERELPSDKRLASFGYSSSMTTPVTSYTCHDSTHNRAIVHAILVAGS